VEVVKMCQWLRAVLEELNVSALKPITLYQDNISAITLGTKDPTSSCTNRSRHYMAKIAYIFSMWQLGVLVILHLGTKKMPTDILTKPLHGKLYGLHTCAMMGLAWLSQFVATTVQATGKRKLVMRESQPGS
jgi:hypothetical protein